MSFLKKFIVPIIKNRRLKFLSTPNIIFLVAVLTLVVIFSPSPLKLKWIGLFLAMFSTMANDSIQTLGTFLTSNSKVSWWKLWIYISILFILIILLGWFKTGGYLDFGKLKDIPYEPDFNIIQLVAPILLIFLTYNKIPASTTFMILSIFSSENMISFMLLKTFSGYALGFTLSFFLWNFLYKHFNQVLTKKDISLKETEWKFLQWASTGLLWVIWLTQNTVNIVVYVPRLFTLREIILFILLGIVMIGFIFYNKGGPIQEIVKQKSDMKNARSATMINLCFAFVILSMSLYNSIPMATTWIFIGILAGREIAVAKYNTNVEISNKYKNAYNLIIQDLLSAGFGITVSLIFSLLNTSL